MLRHGPRGKRPRKRLQPDVVPRLPPPQRHARQLCDNVSEVRDALRPVSVFRGRTAALAHALASASPKHGASWHCNPLCAGRASIFARICRGAD